MPEGHTIHRLAKDHQKWFAGQKMGALSPQGRFSEEAEQISGLKLVSTSAHGKHLFYHWEDGQTMHIHLGLYGKFRVHRNPAPEPRGAVRVRMGTTNRGFWAVGRHSSHSADLLKGTADKPGQARLTNGYGVRN